MSNATTDQQYYEDKDHWGEGQFITLQNLIDNIKLKEDDDSYFKNVKEFRMSIIAKQGLKKLEIDVLPSSRAISFQLPPTKIFPFPRFMNDWYRVSVVTSCNNLKVLTINNNPKIQEYLQDNEYEIIYDSNGEVLQASPQHLDYGKCIKFTNCLEKTEKEKEEKEFEDSWVKEYLQGNYFEFSDDLVDKEIVVEYKSNGLEKLKDSEIKIHNDLELTLEYYIKWKLLEGKRNTPMSEVMYFKQQYITEKRRSSVLTAKKITLQQIIDAVSLSYF